MNKKAIVTGKLFLVAFFLYCFLISIGLMGAAFKGFGKDFAETLINTTSNPLVGLFIGIFATSLVQSSSTVTSIVVGIVGAGTLTVSNAVPIIMGANIGTTVTNTLVSLGHIGRKNEFRKAIAGATMHDFFNLICVCILFPLEIFTGFLRKTATQLSGVFIKTSGAEFSSPVKKITKPVIHLIEDFFKGIFHTADSATDHATEAVSGSPHIAVYIFLLVLSFIILFFSLYFIVKLMRSLIVKKAEVVLDKVVNKNPYIGFAAGLFFTIIVQSSSITTSLLVPLIAAGILSLEGAFPITLGANIGTTTTALLASSATGEINAVTIALVHFLFNFTGVVLIYPVKYFRRIPIRLARKLGYIAAEKRILAFVYVAGVFFALPALLIFISKLFHR